MIRVLVVVVIVVVDVVHYFRTFLLPADVRRFYQTLTDADRKYNYLTEDDPKCDNNLHGWHRFKGAAGTEMVTTCPDVDTCGENNPTWLSEAHPTVSQGSVVKKVCVRKKTGMDIVAMYPFTLK